MKTLAKVIQDPLKSNIIYIYKYMLYYIIIIHKNNYADCQMRRSPMINNDTKKCDCVHNVF